MTFKNPSPPIEYSGLLVLAFKAPGPPAGRRGAVAGGVRGVGPRRRRPRYGGHRPGGRPQRSTLETHRQGDFISLTLSIVHSNSQAHTRCTKTCGFLRHPTTSVPELKLSRQHRFRSFCAHFWGPMHAQAGDAAPILWNHFLKSTFWWPICRRWPSNGHRTRPPALEAAFWAAAPDFPLPASVIPVDAIPYGRAPTVAPPSHRMTQSNGHQTSYFNYERLFNIFFVSMIIRCP